MDSRNAIFQQLKPPCVALNQAILSFQGRRGRSEDVVTCLGRLRHTLTKVQSISGFDSSLAEYVFVPLSYVLKTSQQLPLRAAELTFECLADLLRYGWKEKAAGPLGTQLLILFGITADRSKQSDATVQVPSEDLLRAVLSCFRSLFGGLSCSQRGKAQLLETTAIPHLGHSVTVILGGLDASLSADTHAAAAGALRSLLDCVEDREVLATFLPGIVSSLTRVLTPSTQDRRNWRVLVACLDVLIDVLPRVAGDGVVKVLPRITVALKPSNGQSKKLALDESWLKATAGQLKLALANIARLHSHSRSEVKEALAALNLVILRDCTDALANCRQLCLESILALQEDVETHTQEKISRLMRDRSVLSENLQMALRDWSLSTPRVLEGSDDDKKVRRLKQIFSTYEILRSSGSDTASVQHLLMDGLPEYIATLLGSSGRDTKAIAHAPTVRVEDLPFALQTNKTMHFANALVDSRFQAEFLGVFSTQLDRMHDSTDAARLAQAFATEVRGAIGDRQLSALWLANVLVRNRSTTDEDALFDFGDANQLRWREEVLDDLYDFSLSIIDNDEDDWRLRALSLEIVAAQAVSLGRSFRNELIDVLYPTLHSLGSSSPRLRQHAITCLNVITQACSYDDVKDLVVSNADYLVNAIALKLNSFDVSPQGPQVLIMMVKLAGPSVIPYLEDTVDSIFAILEDYHGYTTLVELLFTTLKTITEQGLHEPRLMLEVPPSKDIYPSHIWSPLPVPDLASFLHERKERLDRPPAPAVAEDTLDAALPSTESEDSTPLNADKDTEKDKQPSGKTFPLLLRIAKQTTHHLPSSSPTLRHTLLTLLMTVIPPLATHENSFLPLINTLWPELVSRLKDDESHIAAATLDVMSLMLRHAKGFMATRVKDIWRDVDQIEARIKSLLADSQSSSSSTKQLSDRPSAPSSGTTTITTRSTEAALQPGTSLLQPLIPQTQESAPLQARTTTLTCRSAPSRTAKVKTSLGPIATALTQARYVDPSVLQLWKALKAFLLSAVQHVGLDAERMDDVVRMLSPVSELSVEEKGVLQVENRGAVWLAVYKERMARREGLAVPKRVRESRERWRWAGVEA